MARDVSIRSYWPEMLQRVREFDVIGTCEDPEIAAVWEENEKLLANTYIFTADSAAVGRMERIFRVQANPAVEPLEFRRLRLQNRLSNQAPYSWRFFVAKLDAMVGAGNYEMLRDLPGQSITIRFTVPDIRMQAELENTLRGLIPADMRLTITEYRIRWDEIEAFGYTWDEWGAKGLTWDQLETYAE